MSPSAFSGISKGPAAEKANAETAAADAAVARNHAERVFCGSPYYVFLRCGYGAPEQERDISIEFYIRDSDVLIANEVSLMFNTPELDENFVKQEKCITFAATCLPRFP